MRALNVRRGAFVALATGSLVLVAACGGSSGSGSSGGTAAESCTPAQSGEKVTLTFSSWVPGMQKTVDLWNEQNPDIQVKYNQVVGGAGAMALTLGR